MQLFAFIKKERTREKKEKKEGKKITQGNTIDADWFLTEIKERREKSQRRREKKKDKERNSALICIKMQLFSQKEGRGRRKGKRRKAKKAKGISAGLPKSWWAFLADRKRKRRKKKKDIENRDWKG
jgi:hypothetical protein